jgi:branched-chain amino acid transport system ATP-binding protein
MGFVAASHGEILLGTTRIDDITPHRRPPLGIGYAPQDRRLFSAFNVEQNLLLPAQVIKLDNATIDQRLQQVYDILPELQQLRERPAGSVSGGQGKMVALGRALMIGSRLILLDEPFQGLAPALAQRYAEALRRLRDQDRSLTLLITESNPALLHNFAELTFTIERGEVVSDAA